MTLRIPYITLLLALIVSCTGKVDPPEPYGPLPSNSQLKWHEMEYFSLVCYGLNKGRYIKLVSESDVRQSGMATFAEIEVFASG